MALKADMQVFVDNITYKSDAAIPAGSAVILKTSQPTGAGVGQAIGSASTVVTVYSGAPASGTKFAGVALNEVVDKEPSDAPRSFLRPSQQFIGENLWVGMYAIVWTNKITGTPTLGADAYLAADSTFGISAVNSNGVVGKWLSTKDSDGYAKLLVKVA